MRCPGLFIAPRAGRQKSGIGNAIPFQRPTTICETDHASGSHPPAAAHPAYQRCAVTLNRCGSFLTRTSWKKVWSSSIYYIVLQDHGCYLLKYLTTANIPTPPYSRTFPSLPGKDDPAAHSANCFAGGTYLHLGSDSDRTRP
ncbi:hypothetical protein VTI28DRAFT_10342 [Corynascus sepedonium]